MPQLSVTQNAIPAQPGMAFDAEASARDVVSAVCAVNIPFGVYCEFNSAGQAVPLQDSTTGGSFAPLKIGISLFDPLGVEQSYVTWGVPTTLAGTVTATNGSTGITFTSSQTLAQGVAIVFSGQAGVEYFIAQATSASTSATLTTKFTGTTASGQTATLPVAGSTNVGWRAGSAAPFMRRGRIWVATDASGSAVQTGPVNVWHSSDGTHNQGVFTLQAVSATAGAEIDIAPGCLVWNQGKVYTPTGNTGGQFTDPFGNTFSMLPVEINV